jgi:hypothetical protein
MIRSWMLAARAAVGQALEREVPDVVPVEAHRPLLHVVEPRHEVRQRGLAGAAGAHHGGELARLDDEADVAQRPGRHGHLLGRRLGALGTGLRGHGGRGGAVGVRAGVALARVAEPHVLHPHLAAHGVAVEGDRARPVGDGGLQVEVLEDAGEQGQRGLHVEGDPQQVDHREQQPGLQGRERHDRAGGDHRSAGDREPGDEVDDRGRDAEEGLDDGEERLAGHRLADLKVHLPLVLGAVAGRLGGLPVEHLGEQDPADRQRLLRDGRHVRQRRLRPGGQPLPDPPDPDLQHDEQRQQRQRHDRELPRQQEHRHQRRRDRDDVRQDGRRGLGQHGLDAAHVVREPRLDGPRLRGGEEAEVHRLQVLEEPAAQGGHHTVAEDGGEVGLADADERRQQRDDDHQGDEEGQQAEPGAAADEERVVEQALGEERRDDAEAARDDDRDGDERQAAAVRPEQRGDAAQEARIPRRRVTAARPAAARPLPAAHWVATERHGDSSQGSG